jgi:hypothetical protein
MKKRTFKFSALAGLLFLCGVSLHAQKVEKESTFNPEGKAKITNLTEVTVDKQNDRLSLFYLTKTTEKRMKAEILHFKISDLGFINAENLEDEFEKIKAKYKLTFSLNFCPESKEPLLNVEPNPFSGQVAFKKGYIQRYYNWNTGLCDDRFKVEERVKPKGDEGEKFKLVNYWTKNEVFKYRALKSYNSYSYNTVTTYQGRTGRLRELMPGNEGDVVFLALIAEKGMKNENIGKNYIIQKFSAEKLEKLSENRLDFDVMAFPLKYKVQPSGNISYIFQRADNFYEFVELDYDGNIARRDKIKAPTDKLWVVDDIIEEGDEVFITGTLSKYKLNANKMYGFVNSVWNIGTMFDNYAYKSTGLQLMKVAANKIEWVQETPITDMKPKFVPISGEKGGKPYAGGPIIVGNLFIAENKNIILTGQKKNNKGQMLEVVAFVFDNQGKMIANYSSKLRDKNDYNKYSPTKHALMDSPSGNGVYWTIFEVAGAKKYGETARTLYYPRIAKISNDAKSVSSFLEVGGRKYFLDDKFPVNQVDDNTFIFLGSNRKGKEMWFSKVRFD